jgi:F-type H+-transporting ATPase subunit epsilon
MSSSAERLQCIIVTPERTVLDEMTEFVVLPLYDGELGVLPGRAPLTGRLGYGEMRATHSGKVERFFIEGGFVQVRADVISVLTPKAVPVKDINVDALEHQAPSLTGEALNKVRAQLRVAGKTLAATH